VALGRPGETVAVGHLTGGDAPPSYFEVLVVAIFFTFLMVDKAIAIGYTPFCATWRRHIPSTRDGLDANSL